MADSKWSRQRLEEVIAKDANSSADEKFKRKFFKRLTDEAAQLPYYKDQVAEHLELFKDNCMQVVSGPDETVRPLLVFTQACVESTLLSMQKDGIIRYVVGIIHTQCPATPVCLPTAPTITVATGSKDDLILAPEIKSDPVRQETVTIRAKIIRKLLQETDIKMNIAYTSEGRTARSEEQLKTYDELLTSHPHNLFDLRLSCSRSHVKDIEGCTYIFVASSGGDGEEGKDGEAGGDGEEEVVYAYTGRGRQANNPDESSASKVHMLGSLRTDSDVRSHVFQVLDFLEDNDVISQDDQRRGIAWGDPTQQSDDL